jgi:hypothetical protein
LEESALKASISAEIASIAPQSPRSSASSSFARNTAVDEMAAGFFPPSSPSSDGDRGRLAAAATGCDEGAKDPSLAVRPDQKRPRKPLLDFCSLSDKDNNR